MIDWDAFREIRVVRPTEQVRAPELKGFGFPADAKDEDCTLTVRGLTGPEKYSINEAVYKSSAMRDLTEGALEHNMGKIMTAVQGALGYDRERTPAVAVERIEYVVRGVIDAENGKPSLDYPDVVKLAEHFPTVFERIAATIMRLSGEASKPVGE